MPISDHDMLIVPIPSHTRLIGRHNAGCKSAKRPEQPRPVSFWLKAWGVISGLLDHAHGQLYILDVNIRDFKLAHCCRNEYAWGLKIAVAECLIITSAYNRATLLVLLITRH